MINESNCFVKNDNNLFREFANHRHRYVVFLSRNKQCQNEIHNDDMKKNRRNKNRLHRFVRNMSFNLIHLTLRTMFEIIT